MFPLNHGVVPQLQDVKPIETPHPNRIRPCLHCEGGQDAHRGGVPAAEEAVLPGLAVREGDPGSTQTLQKCING